MLSYCVYDKKTTANVPGSEKTKVAKNGLKYVLSVCAVCGTKKVCFFTLKVTQPQLNIFFVSLYTPMAEAEQTVDQQQQQPVDSTQQQVTSKAPALFLKTKNPKRVAADKAIAQKTRLAREAHKQKLAEAEMIIAK